jgi:mannose-6-phosphate isomerase-like protein (cupin superfamily)
MSSEDTKLAAFMHAPTVDISTWYKGNLITRLATNENTDGAFDLILAKMKRGTEPPPHCHTREHEFFYLLDGTMDAYCEDKVFHLAAGECAFLPKGLPHAFLITSPEVRVLTLIAPGGFWRTVEPMSVPAEKMEMPSDAVTYPTADPAETIRRFQEHGLSMLSPQEICEQMPSYPMRSA